MNRLIATFLLALGLAASPAFAQSDFQRHALTVDMLQKYKAASLDLKKSIKKKDDGGDKDGMTTDELVKELDATPGVKPILAKHGMTSRSYALTTLALFQAGFYLMMESSMDKKKGAELLASYPAETRGNIALLRKNPQLLKGMED
ncbi:hypothetical protein GCM10027034_11690 [Ramlibacter solisilvae]|uniref:DUF4142 domain-containing protein n=1 Tax=Ramlibacter tataouinensis TaxID=94132 RepID=A0A127JXB2_9BURK|nr:hypothetical protein [Ramlibacter tataouinensis]AMO24545.1 hypothetical protein UC35_18985 [Ramlibacter tataouinensis]